MTATKSPRTAQTQASKGTPAGTATVPVKRAAPAKRTTPVAAKRRAAPAKAVAPVEVAPAAALNVVTLAKADKKAAPAPARKKPAKAASSKTPATKPVVRIDDGKKAKTQKIVSGTYSIPQNEHAALKSLRAELKKTGRRTSKSEVLRAGLRLLLEQDAATLLARINALPPAAAKAKSKKD